MASRLRWILAIAILGMLCSSLSAQTARAQEPVKNDAGAAQPRAAEKNPDESASQQGGSAEEMKNSPVIRSIARATGLSNAQVYWISVLVNFAGIVVVLGWIYKKQMPGVLRSRNESIQKRIEEARKSGEEARRRLTDVEGRLARLDAEIAEMKRQADENAQLEEKRIQDEAEQERQRIMRAAEQDITAAVAAARRALRAYAGELAINLAEKKINVGRDTDQMLVRDFTVQLGKDGN
ncbi:MAG TPA: ATP synthase F0 subunit B [Candidatus Angelobacter sp.]|nr:ATP synthase F0 subunit B [Candidatus Angelobacter sp.]